MKPSNPFEPVVSPGERVREAVASRRQGPGYARGLQVFRAVLPALLIALATLISTFSSAQVSVLTYHGDNNRSGMVNETLLTPNNVNFKQFGKLFTYSVDGFVVAQPLYVPNVSIPGQGTHNVVYVVTQHDSVFAFDADTPASVPLWEVSLIPPGWTTVPISVSKCPDVGYTEIGIMGTPVIDPATGTLFVSAKAMQGSTTEQTVHALDITTGQEKFNGPVSITASLTAPNGDSVAFKPLQQFQRPALLLSHGIVYVAFGSNGCDTGAWGWLFAIDAGETSGRVQQLAYYNTAPDAAFGASIWQSGSGPAADSEGNVFLMTANGLFDFSTGKPDLGDSFLELNYSSNTLTLENYFTPWDQSNMKTNDLDLGSGGVLLIPTSEPGLFPNLLIGAGKTGTIYLLNRDNLGGYVPGNANPQAVQWLQAAVGPMFSTPVYWNSTNGQMVYFGPNKGALQAFSLALDTPNNEMQLTSAFSSGKVGVAGVPTLSANGENDGLLWITLNATSPILASYDATNLVELYSSNQAPTRDGLGSHLPHFITPMVANGKVYVGTQSNVAVYGLLPFLSTTGGGTQSCTVGANLPLPITVQAVNSLGVGVVGVTVNFNDGGKGGTPNPTNAITNSSGTATTVYTCPQKAQMVTITASSTGYISAVIKETAVAGAPTAIAVVSGGGQTGTHGKPLPLPIVAKLHDLYMNAVPGIPVTFTATPSGGSFSPSTPVMTGANGEASVTYTCPATPGSVKITASYSTLTPANVNETCQ
jgi:hypothetical protein